MQMLKKDQILQKSLITHMFHKNILTNIHSNVNNIYKAIDLTKSD
jgi:hypothetical protein